MGRDDDTEAGGAKAVGTGVDTAHDDTLVASASDADPTSRRVGARTDRSSPGRAWPPDAAVSFAGDLAALPVVARDCYQMIGEFAQGGIGRISEARDRRLDRVVAIKELRRNTPYAVARFAREVRITAKLQHPSIVALHEAGRWPSGEPFFAMQMVAGGSLEDAIDSCVTLEDHVRLVRNVADVADAIAYAHSERVVHRDLKPSNVLVGLFGETVVIDWGLAKDLAHDEPELVGDIGEVEDQPYHTTDGVVLGTPPYMPPEQATGRPIDERADVYALGAILYHVLSGRVPYFEYHPRDVLHKVVTRPPTPLAELKPDAPPDLLAIVDKAMAREPEDRYPTAHEMTQELGRFISGGLVSAYHYSFAELARRFVEKNLAAVATGALGVIVLAVLGTWSFVSITEQRNFAIENATQAELARSEAEKRLEQALLQEARTAVGQDPTYALARLKALKAPVAGAASVAADAVEAGVAVRVLQQHRERIDAVAFSNDDALVATSGHDGVVMLWSLGGGEPIALDKHVGRVPALAFSARGLVSAGYDHKVLLWDANARTATLLGEHTAPVKAVTVSRDGRHIATVGDDGVRVWGNRKRFFDAKADRPMFASFSPDATRLLSGSHASELSIWSLEGDGHATLRGHTGDINQAVWAPDGALVASAGADGTLRIWNAAGEQQRELVHGTDGVKALAFTPNGAHVVSGDMQGVVRISSIDGAHEVKLFDHSERVESIAVSPKDGRFIASASWDRTIAVFDLVTGNRRTLLGHRDVVSALSFSSDGKLLASSSWDSDARLWRIEANARRTLRGHGVGVKAIAFSPDGGALASGAHDDTLRLWRVRDGELIRVLEGHSDHVFRVVYSPDGRWIASSSDDRTVRLWPWDGSAPQVLTGHRADVEELAFSRDNQLLASAGEDHAVGLWKLDGSGRMLVGHRGPVTDVDFGASTLASSSSDGTIRLWSTAGDLERTIDVGSPVQSIAFSPDGKALASASDDGRVTLWSLDGQPTELTKVNGIAQLVVFSADGQTLAIATNHPNIALCPTAQGPCRTLLGHASRIHAMAFTKRDQGLVSASGDHTVRMWSVASGESITLRGHDAPVFDVAVSPTSDIAASASADMTVRLWPIVLPPEPERLASWLADATTYRARP
jgi:WD40 repeat protein